jgi:antitoxin component of RelBE/YafQ-DinJ toxin-antitoxin module
MRRNVITVRLSDREYVRFTHIAERMGLNVSAMIRALVAREDLRAEPKTHKKKKKKTT